VVSLKNLALKRHDKRQPFEEGRRGKEVWTHLPEDFGTIEYADRRSGAIEEHFTSVLASDRDELLWQFDYWLTGSERLREYLWAHHPEDIALARQIVQVLPSDVVLRILRYLIGSYWGRFCGWPDLLAYNTNGFIFLEVKSSNDKLSEDQKHWIEGNATLLNLPFKLVKIHKTKVVDLPESRRTGEEDRSGSAD